MNENQTNKPPTISKFIQGKRKWLIAAGAVIVTAILAMLLASGKTSTSAPSKTLSTFSARRDNLTVTVTESGSIKARKSIDLKSEVEGRATIVNIVPEGSFVTQEDVNNGKILVELDSGDLKEQLTQRQIDFTTAEAGYAEAKEAYDIQVKQNESDVTSAQLKVKFALMDLKKYLGETLAEKLINDVENDPNSTYSIGSLLDDPNKLSQTEAAQKLTELQDEIELAGSKLAKAQYKLEGTQQLYDANYVAKIELQGDELEKRSCEVQNKQAGISLELFKLYDFPKQAEKLLSDYYESRRELDRTYAKTRSQLAQAKARLESAKARLDLQEDRLNKSKKQFAACTMKAPAPGLVVYGSSMDPWRRYSGEGLIAAGEQVYQRQTIITLPDTSEMIAEITVHESSVDKVKLGQKATIVMDAFPDQTLRGEVSKVASLPDQQRSWLSPDIKVYATEVNIEGTHNFLKPGMSARVEILVDYLPDVLIVPVQVVANRGGKKICFAVNSGKPVEREVKTGQFNDTSVQIIDGLKEGEEVLLNPPRITETKTEPNQPPDKFQKTRRREPMAIAESTNAQPETQDPNRAGQKIPDPNQMDEQTKEKFKQTRNRAREKSDGAAPRQNP